MFDIKINKVLPMILQNKDKLEIKVSGFSMEPTLYDGDLITINSFNDYSEGDILVFIYKHGFSMYHKTNNIGRKGTYSMLDVGDFNTGFSLAYDWMYDEWTDEERTNILGWLLDKGMDEAVIKVQDEYLLERALEKGIVGLADIPTVLCRMRCSNSFASLTFLLYML